MAVSISDRALVYAGVAFLSGSQTPPNVPEHLVLKTSIHISCICARG